MEVDCAGVCGGEEIEDACGECGGNGPQYWCEDYQDFICSELDCISYGSDIQPIFNQYCIECHSYSGSYNGGLILTSYSELLYGGDNGSSVIPGDSENSLLYDYIASGYMPYYTDDLDQSLIDIIGTWIDYGANGPLDDGSDDGGGATTGGGDDGGFDGCDEGEIFDCDTCGTELEVIGVDPLELSKAPELEEDWGE